MSNEIEKVANTDISQDLLQELKEAQQEIVSSEESLGVSSIKFISTVGNALSLDNVDFPGNALACFILDSIGVHALYTEQYDPERRTPPQCFAFSRTKEGFAPNEEDVEDKQSDTCSDCEMQEWGSATLFPLKNKNSTKAKACSSKRRLAILGCGDISKTGSVSLYNDNDTLREALNSEILFLEVSVTSVKNYRNYAIKMNTKYKGNMPLFCIPTKISVVPDKKNQRTILFEEIKTSMSSGKEEIVTPMRSATVVKELLDRHREAKELIATPWPKASELEQHEDAANAKYSVKKKA